MATTKKLACFATIALLLAYVTFAVVAAPTCAVAETTEWVRVVDEGVFLYANNYSSKVVCILEKSYYLQVISEADTMLFVTIMGTNSAFPAISGYVWTSQVKKCKTAPQTPYYPTETVTVDTDSAAVKLSPVPSAETLVVATNTQRLSYYGQIISYGETWYYVYYGGKFGYVRAQSVTSPNVSPHPTPMETTTPVVNPTPTEPEPQPENADNATAKTNAGTINLFFIAISLYIFIAPLVSPFINCLDVSANAITNGKLAIQ